MSQQKQARTLNSKRVRLPVTCLRPGSRAVSAVGHGNFPRDSRLAVRRRNGRPTLSGRLPLAEVRCNRPSETAVEHRPSPGHVASADFLWNRPLNRCPRQWHAQRATDRCSLSQSHTTAGNDACRSLMGAPTSLFRVTNQALGGAVGRVDEAHFDSRVLRPCNAQAFELCVRQCRQLALPLCPERRVLFLRAEVELLERQRLARVDALRDEPLDRFGHFRFALAGTQAPVRRLDVVRAQ